MSFELLFDQAQRILVVRFGPVLNRETIAAMRAAAKRFTAGAGPCRAIVDFSAVETVDVSAAFIGDLARSGSVVGGERRAIVAPRPEVFGIARMYELQQATTDDEIAVVRTMDEARAALGLQPLTLAPVAPER